jgi:ectoine hydroxylase-related dioxygenase (phytanoyl-CoA dioxygenase family)
MDSQLHDLQTRYFLEQTTLRQFNEDGFIRLPRVLSAETLAAFEPEITRKVIELNIQHLPLDQRDTHGRAFLQVMNLWEHSGRAKELVFSPRLAGIAADLLGVESVRLYHDQALYKEPGGGVTPWHADQYYWPLSTDRTVTAWIPLQDTPLDMGPLAFAAGSHRFEYGRDLPISDQSERELQKALIDRGFALVEGQYRLGDASFHLGWTFHRASPNNSECARRVMTVIYMDAQIRVTRPINDSQRGDLRKWMPGARIGSVPASPLNPILYGV